MLTQQAKHLGIHPSCKKKVMVQVPAQIVKSEPDPPFSEWRFNKLRKYAKAKGIKVPRGTSKPELIKILKGE